MSADQFYNEVSALTAEAAFQSAVDDALYEYGHAGYTGTIGEKDQYTMIPIPDDFLPGDSPHDRAHGFAQKLEGEDDPRITDKWGPAGCIEYSNGPDNDPTFIFFGWASS